MGRRYRPFAPPPHRARRKAVDRSGRRASAGAGRYFPRTTRVTKVSRNALASPMISQQPSPETTSPMAWVPD